MIYKTAFVKQKDKKKDRTISFILFNCLENKGTHVYTIILILLIKNKYNLIF